MRRSIGICDCSRMASNDNIIAELRRIVDAQSKQIAAQAKQIVAQVKRIDELEVNLVKALKDSSKSPSSDYQLEMLNHVGKIVTTTVQIFRREQKQ